MRFIKCILLILAALLLASACSDGDSIVGVPTPTVTPTVSEHTPESIAVHRVQDKRGAHDILSTETIRDNGYIAVVRVEYINAIGAASYSVVKLVNHPTGWGFWFEAEHGSLEHDTVQLSRGEDLISSPCFLQGDGQPEEVKFTLELALTNSDEVVHDVGISSVVVTFSDGSRLSLSDVSVEPREFGYGYQIHLEPGETKTAEVSSVCGRYNIEGELDSVECEIKVDLTDTKLRPC